MHTSVDLGWGLESCLYNQLLGEVDAAGLWTNFGNKELGDPVHVPRGPGY